MEVPVSNRKYKIYDGVKDAKLGTEKNPAVVRVKTKERRKEVAAIFKKNNWQCKIELTPDKPEDITALKKLLKPAKPQKAKEKVGRNDPCPCGSGKKYKKCCGK
jgi:SWIM/SEC-C metal-binding protein